MTMIEKTVSHVAGRVECSNSLKPTVRPLSVIAKEIKKDWQKMYFGAVPYWEAMSGLNSINDSYGYDSAKSIVLYFLGNASGWRGETAKRIKLELNAMCKAK
jgi:hypothetical protein